MIVAAPGKLVLTGAYAVLEGAPAIVVAIDRHAHADTSRRADAPTAEVREALGDHADDAPYVDASALYRDGSKLGLGSSAAVLVASLGARAAARGEDLRDPDVRSRIFQMGRAAHQAAQGGGSGVDVAASTYGGVLRYSVFAGRAWVVAGTFPEDLHLAAYFSGTSARTSDLLAKVDALKAAEPDAHHRHFVELGVLAQAAAETFEGGSVREFVAAAREFVAALDRLGDAADAPIVPLDFRRLDVVAADEGAVFLPAGAGGGDVGVFLGPKPPSEGFAQRATSFGMHALDLHVDRDGVRVSDAPQAPPR